MNTPADPRAAFSPAFEDDEPTLTEQRRYRRHDLRAEVSFSCQQDFYTYRGVTADVSPGGVVLATEHLLPVGEMVALTFTIPGFVQELEATAEIRWVREQRFADSKQPAGMGLKFVQLPRQTRESMALVLLW